MSVLRIHNPVLVNNHACTRFSKHLKKKKQIITGHNKTASSANCLLRFVHENLRFYKTLEITVTTVLGGFDWFKEPEPEVLRCYWTLADAVGRQAGRQAG